MRLVFQFVEQPPVQNAGILLFGGNNYRVGFLDTRQVFAGGGDYRVCDPPLDDFPQLPAFPGIRPQNKDHVRYSFARATRGLVKKYNRMSPAIKTKKRASLSTGCCDCCIV